MQHYEIEMLTKHKSSVKFVKITFYCRKKENAPVYYACASSYFPNKSLCVPVRDNVNTSKSFSMR